MATTASSSDGDSQVVDTVRTSVVAAASISQVAIAPSVNPVPVRRTVTMVSTVTVSGSIAETVISAPSSSVLATPVASGRQCRPTAPTAGELQPRPAGGDTHA